jgi:phage terminase small subunit
VAELNYKQRLFVSAFVGQAKGNATEAARIAGYGNSDAYASVAGHRLLRNDKIQVKIAQRASCVALSANEVLARVAELATADIADFIDIDQAGDYTVNLKRAKRRGTLRNVKKLKRGEHGVEIELRDSLAALTLLGKYHALWDREPSQGDLAESIKARLKEKTEERLRRRGGQPNGSGPGSTDR